MVTCKFCECVSAGCRNDCYLTPATVFHSLEAGRVRGGFSDLYHAVMETGPSCSSPQHRGTPLQCDLTARVIDLAAIGERERGK